MIAGLVLTFKAHCLHFKVTRGVTFLIVQDVVNNRQR